MSQLKAIVDKLLTNVSNGYFPEGFISESLLPKLQVKQLSGLLGAYGTSHLRIEHSFMGGRGEARRVEPITRSSQSYLLEKHGLEGIVTPEDRDNVEDPYDAEADEVMGLTNLIMVEKERALASALTAVATMTQYQTLSGTSQWSDYANSDPLSICKTAQEAVFDGCGQPANTMICPWEVYNVLSYHPQILEQLGFKYNVVGSLNAEQLKAAFRVSKIFIPTAQYESAAEGQTSSMAAIWGKDVVFAYVPDSAQKYQKSLGYLVQKAGVGSKKVYKYAVNNPPDSTGIICIDYYDFLLSDVKAGYLVKAAVA